MNLFRKGDLRAVLEAQRSKLRQEIDSQQEDYLLNANETQLASHFTEKYRIDPIMLHEDKVYATDREEMIPAERFDSFRFHVVDGNSYRKQVIRFHLPFSGEADLFQYMPSTRILWSADVPVERGEVCLDVVVWSDGDTGRIKQDWDSFLNSLRTQMKYSTDEVQAYNSNLEQNVIQMLQERKQGLLKKRNVLASLGVPVKKASNVADTFAIPALKKKVVVAKPAASVAPFVPEPTLDESTYRDILKIIHDTGIEIERHPSVYEGKDEETLRDHLLMVLAPHFSSVTGETFNKAGKTDILIRHEGKNVFVAECGVWKGAKQFHGKIDQLLSYLTWRDSKTAVICFVRNKDFTSVLQTIIAETPKHPCFVKDHGRVCEAWLKYDFSLKDDSSRRVQVAVLCFHFP